MFLHDLLEGAIATKNVGAAMSKIISYLGRATGDSFTKLGIEQFKNSKNHGWGERYLIDGSLKCIRFNWVGKKSSEIESVDFWLGNQRDPNFNIVFKDTSLVKAVPALASVLKAPKIGKFNVSAAPALTEAKKGEFTPESAVADMIEKLESGRSFNRSEFVMSYHPENAFAFDEFVEKFKDQLIIQGKRISVPKGETISGPKKGKKSVAEGSLVVAAGGSGEEYEVEVPDADDRVSYTDALGHLEDLTQGLIKGSFNALFVAGKGGTGKTQTVEEILHSNGLSDGKGYFKITGSASPIGMYSTLYKYRNGIILFDDCDGALESQDGRNIIKAATDTKKIRKVAWGKKNAGMYDPDTDEEQAQKAAAKARAAAAEFGDDEGDEDEQTDGDMIPRWFNFTGQIIFISNLPLNKLDPDGALRTRAFIIAINPTPDEIIERMGQILNHIKLENGLTLTDKERVEVLNVIKAGRRKSEASLRTLVRALNLAASGVSSWKQLVSLYA